MKSKWNVCTLRHDSWSFIIPFLIADWHIIYVENIFLYHQFYTIKHLILIPPPKIVIEDIFAALRENSPLILQIEIIFPLISKPQFSGPPCFKAGEKPWNRVPK